MNWRWCVLMALLAALPVRAQLEKLEQLLSFGAARVGFIASEEIRKRFPEAQQAEQRLRSLSEEWQRTLEEYSRRIEELEEQIRRNRLLWTEEELRQNETQLERLRRQQQEFARQRFGPGGSYDSAAAAIYRPVEAKIYAAVQEVALAEGVDFVWDKSRHPLLFANPRYDLTVKVLKRLGVEAKDLETQQQRQLQELERQRKGAQASENAPRAPRRRPAPSEGQAPEGSAPSPEQPPEQDRPIPR
jgi:outer membrane protein